MAHKRQKLDRQPGELPDIRTSNGNLIYTLPVARQGDGAHLVIVCTPDGTLWASIGRPTPPPKST